MSANLGFASWSFQIQYRGWDVTGGETRVVVVAGAGWRECLFVEAVAGGGWCKGAEI